ncbi:MAG: DUF488 family protein [Chloroflexi bacterium]|nr:DUF488 family protein [Chloroflexota bacterium]
MDVRLKRAYDEPDPSDGARVLVDRVWPRGRSRDALRLAAWERDIAPSTELRRWFGHDPARWAEFRSRYEAELREPDRQAAMGRLAGLAAAGRLTLVFGAADAERNQAVAIRDALLRRGRETA